MGGIGFNIWNAIVRSGSSKNETGSWVLFASFGLFLVCQHRILRQGLVPDPAMRWQMIRFHIAAIGIWACIETIFLTLGIAWNVRFHIATFGEWPQLEGPILTVLRWWVGYLTLALASIPAYRWSRRRHRLAQNHCVACDYDLTGNESGRCPECGQSKMT